MAQLFDLPFEGENKLASPYGRRTLNGAADIHGGWDWHPMANGVKLTKAMAQWPAAGTVNWLQVWDGYTKTGDMSFGNCERILTAEDIYCYMAHLYDHQNTSGARVLRGGSVGHIGPTTTGNSTGNHLHAEFRAGGRAASYRVNPGEMYGIANIAGVTYHRERMAAATVGLLTCTKASYRWRVGAGADRDLFTDDNNGALMYCRVGVIYRVYAVETVGGVAWYQITPPASCITAGGAPALYVCGECGSYTPTAPAGTQPEATEPAPAAGTRYLVAVGLLTIGDVQPVLDALAPTVDTLKLQERLRVYTTQD